MKDYNKAVGGFQTGLLSFTDSIYNSSDWGY